MNRSLIAPLVVTAVLAVLLLSALGGLGQAAATPASGNLGLALGATHSATSCTEARIPLGEAGHFRVLAGTTVTNTGATVVRGNLGLSPGSAVTGFPPGKVTGTMYVSDTTSANAQTALLSAYNNGKGRTSTCDVLVHGNLGGQTLGPGLYTASSALSISSGDLTLTANGNSKAVFIFQIGTKFTMTSGRTVILAGGARAANIYWVVGSSATLGTTAVLYGNILAHKSISFATGATLHGRALAQIGAVTLAGNTVDSGPLVGLGASTHLVSASVPSAPAPSISTTMVRVGPETPLLAGPRTG